MAKSLPSRVVRLPAAACDKLKYLHDLYAEESKQIDRICNRSTYIERELSDALVISWAVRNEIERLEKWMPELRKMKGPANL